MAYHCFRCQAPLAAGSFACGRCGQKFDAPVPAMSSPSGVPASFNPAPKTRGRAGLWIAGILGAVVLVMAAAGFAAYHAFQAGLGGGLSRGLPGSVAEAGHQGRWTPSGSLTAQLGPEQQIGGPNGQYALQPPAGYTLRQVSMQATDGTSQIYAWNGPQAADGTAPQFVVILGGGPAMMAPLTSSQYVQMGLMSARRDHVDLKASPVQSGSVHGLPFSRAYWKGAGARTGRRFHGMVYCLIAAPNMIMISGKDSEPASRSTLPLFDAAALTLHKI